MGSGTKPEDALVGIGVSIPRKESDDKVTGTAKYTDDIIYPGLLQAWLLTSPHAHARLKSIDIRKALEVPGVRAVVTGKDCPDVLMGSIIEDQPPLARHEVRHFGEIVAVVVADSIPAAKRGAAAIEVDYEPLPVVNSIEQALKSDAPLVHEESVNYTRVKPQDIIPVDHTNIAGQIRVRKGNPSKGWAESEVIVEGEYRVPQSDHAAMETHSARAEIRADGRVFIRCANQGPYTVRKYLTHYFDLDDSRVVVEAPLVGGGFGGKTPFQLEILAYLASKAVRGRPVNLTLPREYDIASCPVHLGLVARVKLGATREGTLKAGEYTYYVDTGAYCNTGPKMTRAMAADCTGPYRIPNVQCDAYCVYTNHPVVTAWRGFGRFNYVFAVERAMDKLAYALKMDALELRAKNAIAAGDTTPTQAKLTPSNLGDLPACITRAKELINWDEGRRTVLPSGAVRAKGLGALWKTSSSPPDAVAGAILLMNADGTLSLNVGAVDYGEGTKTTLAQMVAERLKWNVDKIGVFMEVNTEVSPHYWKTVASMTTYMVGNAVMDATEDLLQKVRSIVGIVLRCPPEALEVAGGKCYLKEDPTFSVSFKSIAKGYQFTGGYAIGGQIIGVGTFIMRHLHPMDRMTGKGKLGPSWTAGIQAAEVEYYPWDYSYKLLRAVTVIDAGKVLNPKGASGIVMGGMNMGLSTASREGFTYDAEGRVQEVQLRTYHLLRFGEQPHYQVEFVERPQLDAPFGARQIGEHGVVGVGGALGNALSCAAEVELNELPLTPERIWRAKTRRAARRPVVPERAASGV